MRILIFLIVLLLPVTALAEIIDSAGTDGKPRVVAAVDPLVLWEKPALDAPVAVEEPLPWNFGGAAAWPTTVYVLDDTGPAVTIKGKQDRWVQVALTGCIENDCSRRIAGWVPDSHLGYDGRFKPLSLGRNEAVVGFSRAEAFVYRIQRDGSYTKWSASCTIGACRPLPKGMAADCGYGNTGRNGFCVQTGTLHRYRDLVYAEASGREQAGEPQRNLALIVGPQRELCAFDSERGGARRMCDRPGSPASFGTAPGKVLEAVMAARRKVTALTAADLLNLRESPSTKAAIVSGLPRGTGVKLLDKSGPVIKIDGKSDRWVKVMVLDCDAYAPFGACEAGAIGWTVGGFLASEDRLKKVTEWRETRLGGYLGDLSFEFDIAADGTVNYSMMCEDGEAYNGYNDCKKSGQLYRYRDLMVARFKDAVVKVELLQIEDQGKLCIPPTKAEDTSYSPRCEP